MKYIILGIAITVILILVIIAIILKSKSDKIKEILIKITEAEENISLLLGKKMELVININNYIEDKSEDKLFDDVGTIVNKELDSHEQNAMLNSCYDKILELVDYNNDVILDDEEYKDIKKLKEVSINLKGVENYYNDNINILNDYIGKFPNNIVAKSKKIKKREPYINEKSEIFEILKK
jgi:hypothetical protein